MKTENLEDIYQLSPVQHGILFHSLYAPELGLYFIQFIYTVKGNLDLVAFEQAWQQVVDGHTALRTSFYWEDIEKPLQVVHRQVKVPIEHLDLRGIDPVEQQRQLKSFLESDRQRGFDFSQPPLMRLTLIRMGDRHYEFIFSKHHLILDGWATALVLKDFIQVYEAISQGQNLSVPPSSCFGDYIAWLQQQDISKAEVFWRELLRGIKAPTPITNLEINNLTNEEERYDEAQIKLSVATTAALQSFARKNQLTLNTLIQGSWALLLSHYSCQNDIVYGCTVSARPTDLAAAQSMAGTFVNTLPVRVKVDPEQFLLNWLKQLQALQVEMRQYDYTPLVEIQGWSEIPRGLPLFNSFVVFENYPVDRILRNWEGEIEFQEKNQFYKTNYPLTIVGHPGSELILGINYDCRRFDAATINSILRHLQILLEGMMTNPEVPVKDLLLLTEPGQHVRIILEKEVTFDFCKVA